MSDLTSLANRLNHKLTVNAEPRDSQVVSAKISNLQHVISQLSSPEFGKEADPEVLYKKFLQLHHKFNEFTKLTNSGKATPELKKTKLKVLQDWLNKYEDPAQAVISGLPKKYQNKNVTLNPRALREVAFFKNYIHYIMDFMNKLGPRYVELKGVVSDLLEKGKTLQTHMDKFLLTDDFVPDFELLAADDEETEITGDLPEVSPVKMLKTIQTIINKYHKFSVATSNKYKEIEQLVNELEPIDLADFLQRTNTRNKLIQSLLRNLVDINRTLYQTNLPDAPFMRDQYYKLVEQSAPLLPDHIGNRLLATIKPHKGKGRFQQVLDQSLQGVQKSDPTKDPNWSYQSPHVQNYAPLPEPAQVSPGNMQERVDRKLRHQELADISQREGKPLSPTDKAKYEELWKK